MKPKHLHKTQRRLRFWLPLVAITAIIAIKLAPLPNTPEKAFAGAGKDDWNADGVIDIEDLRLFSEAHVDVDWQTVDWCQWLKEPNKKHKHMGQELKQFTSEYFSCTPPHPVHQPAKLVNNRKDYPTRMVFADDGVLYVCDNRTDEIVLFECIAEMGADPVTGEDLVADVELKEISRIGGLDKPLGIGLDADGNIAVGNSKRRNVEVYSPDGTLIRTIGQGEIEVPNDLDFDLAGNLYVVDSKWNLVRVYDYSTGKQLRTITDGNMKFPSAIEVVYRPSIDKEEVFIADKGNHVIKVFDTEGTFLRSFGARVRKGGMMGTNWYWRGRFDDLQAIEMDSQGRLHVLDGVVNVVQILNPDIPGGFDTQIYYGSYGWRGSEPGFLKTALDFALIEIFGRSAVANYGNKRIELLTIP